MLELRPVIEADAALLWEWLNDPEALANYFHSNPVTWGTHVAWLRQALSNRQRRMWIALASSLPVGLVEYELEYDEAEVSISVAKACRGQGYGKEMLALGDKQMAREYPLLAAFTAQVKQGNVVSCRTFEACGYHRAGPFERDGVACWLYRKILT